MSRQAKDNFLVLVADDSAEDRHLLRTAMLRAARLQIIAEVSDGGGVIAYLRRNAGSRRSEEFPSPDLLLLDLNMPGQDGFEVLEWLRAHPLHNLKVVVLTDSVQPEYIRRALDLGADLFQVKPRNHQDLVSMVLALEQHLLIAAPTAPLRHFSDSSAPRPNFARTQKLAVVQAR